jgi:hypothetical protein
VWEYHDVSVPFVPQVTAAHAGAAPVRKVVFCQRRATNQGKYEDDTEVDPTRAQVAPLLVTLSDRSVLVWAWRSYQVHTQRR